MDVPQPVVMFSENKREWVWDAEGTTQTTLLKRDNQEVCFHPIYSYGTAAVRGNMPFTAGRDYFWEIEILTPVYGTDVIIGVGTAKVDLIKYQFKFKSLLGSDGESWGYSYRGQLHHKGVVKEYQPGFRQGSVIGVHLDMWHGTLEFYLNRHPLGVAFTSLKAHTLYPMVCSTAARSTMRILCSYSYPSSLQWLCLKTITSKPDLVEKVVAIPGLKAYAEKTMWHFYPCSCDVFRSDEGIRFSPDNPEDQQSFTSAVIAGKIQCTHVAGTKKQTAKRQSDNEKTSETNISGENLCVICQQPEKSNIQPTTGQGSSSKRMCFVCDIIF